MAFTRPDCVVFLESCLMQAKGKEGKGAIPLITPLELLERSPGTEAQAWIQS